MLILKYVMMLHLPLFSVYSVFLSSSLLLLPFSGLACGEDLILGHTVEIEFGEDRGQSFGNLFELIDDEGNVLGGAGFLDVYNTRFRNDRYKLQFYIKPTKQTDPLISRHPVPTRHTGLFIFDEGETIYGWADDRHTYEFDTQTNTWAKSRRYEVGNLPSGFGGMKLGDGYLSFRRSGIYFNDKLAVHLPASGRVYNFYYAEHHLFFFHQDQSNDEQFTKIYAVPWKPGDTTVDALPNSPSITCRYPRTTPFSWGQHQGRVVTVGNYGGIYTFVDGKWIEELQGSDQTSYQVYAQMHFNGTSYMAQYPTGNLFAYDKGPPKHLPNWPPKLPQVSPSAREAMSLGIYGGKMHVGVWPWAELWALNADADQWNYIARGFTHPELTDQQVHPYEKQAMAQGLVQNHWGQRITSLVPHGDALYIATSSKGSDHWTSDRDFLPKHQADEYGSLLKLTLPGSITATIEWHPNSIDLRFYVYPNRIEIRRGKITLGSAAITREMYNSVLTSTPRPGTGVFGPTALKRMRIRK